jgi:pSer/pThr/pTyr-binding forkhead associated (FHA) protein
VSAPFRVVWHRPDGSQAEFPLAAEVVLIGRDETADIRVEEPLVSRAHARIERRGERHWLIDLGSTNLTRVNGEVIRERRLDPGDELQFGRARCEYVGAPTPAAAGGK